MLDKIKIKISPSRYFIPDELPGWDVGKLLYAVNGIYWDGKGVGYVAREILKMEKPAVGSL